MLGPEVKEAKGDFLDLFHQSNRIALDCERIVAHYKMLELTPNYFKRLRVPLTPIKGVRLGPSVENAPKDTKGKKRKIEGGVRSSTARKVQSAGTFDL